MNQAIIIPISAAAILSIVMVGLYFAGVFTKPDSPDEPGYVSTTSTTASWLLAAAAAGVDITEYSTCERARSAGEENERDFIVGGEEVRNKWRYPWMAKVYAKTEGSKTTVCGGSILDDQHILTAAHCINSLPNTAGLVQEAHKIQVGVGSISGFQTPNRVGVRGAFFHSGFTKIAHHDIAVLRLNQSLSDLAGWATTIKPVCLPAATATAPSTCEMTGWGKTVNAAGSSLPNVLRRIDLETHDYIWCKEAFENKGEEYPFIEGQICTGTGPKGGRDICQGDSGGPLVCRKDKEAVMQQFGVASWTSSTAPCGSVPGYESAFTSVPFYRAWTEYVAKPVLADVVKARAWLDCQRTKCLRLAGQRSGETDFLVKNREYLCPIFAAYEYCVGHDPKPDRCTNTVLPPILYRSRSFLDRGNSTPSSYNITVLLDAFISYGEVPPEC